MQNSLPYLLVIAWVEIIFLSTKIRPRLKGSIGLPWWNDTTTGPPWRTTMDGGPPLQDLLCHRT